MSSRIDQAYQLISQEIEWLEQEAARLRQVRAQLDIEAQTGGSDEKVRAFTQEQVDAVKEPTAKLKGVTVKKMLKCPHCDLVYKSQGWLDRHIENEHTDSDTGDDGELMLRCDDCNFTTQDDVSLMASHVLHTHDRALHREERIRSTR